MPRRHKWRNIIVTLFGVAGVVGASAALIQTQSTATATPAPVTNDDEIAALKAQIEALQAQLDEQPLVIEQLAVAEPEEPHPLLAALSDRLAGYADDVRDLPNIDFAPPLPAIPSVSTEEPGRRSYTYSGPTGFGDDGPATALIGDTFKARLDSDVNADKPGQVNATVVDGAYQGARIVCRYSPIRQITEITIDLNCFQMQIDRAEYGIAGTARPVADIDANLGMAFAAGMVGASARIAADAAYDTASGLTRDAVRESRTVVERTVDSGIEIAPTSPTASLKAGTIIHVSLTKKANLP